MMNFKFSVLVLAFVTLAVAPFAAYGRENDLRTLYQLCSRSPSNSRCAGQNIPIPLLARTGELTSCVLRIGREVEQSPCKLNQTNTGLTLYLEVGKPVELLENQRGTKELTIASDRIFALNYQNWGKTNRAEIGYSRTPEGNAKNQTAFLEIIGDDELTAWLKPKLAVPLLSPDRLPSASSSSTDVAAATKQLLETKECVGCNLQGANLQDAKLGDANLEGANLQGANLQGARLSGAYLVGANLDQANLTKARLNYANLTLSSLQEAVLEEADLQAINLQGANGQRANLNGAKLSAPAMLQGVNLANANLQDAKLEGAVLTNANLESANLQGADLSDTSITSSGLVDRYTFGEAALNFAAGGLLGVGLGALSQRGVQFRTNLEGANLTNANLTGANLEDAVLLNTNFSNANFKDVKLEDADLSGANLCGATMPNGDRSIQGCP
jgi:uncharacterized protein YjbI with pentapeptide repeats